jgi:hypothetical protein
MVSDGEVACDWTPVSRWVLLPMPTEPEPHTVVDMLVNVTVRDESAGGRSDGDITLLAVPSATTVRDLIRTRVRDEVARYNTAPAETFRGLVMPEGAEPIRAGRFAMPVSRRIDWERQADRAVDAFGRNRFFVLVDHDQVTDLDQPLELTADTDIRFIRLVSLVGG